MPANDQPPIRLVAMKGDGIGPEIVDATLGMLRAAADAFNLTLDIAFADIGFASLDKTGTTITNDVVAQARSADGVILGPVSHNDYPPLAEGGRNPSGVLRKELDLFANVRPARTRPGLDHPIRQDFDLVIVRENTEGFYADRNMAAGTGEFMPTDDVALAIRKVTTRGSRRIAKHAFELATRRRGKVTAVHKANVLRLSDGLFLEQVRAVSAEYPRVAYEEQLVDSMTALLIRKPDIFDVVVTTNMFGDILSDEASELSGSLGLAASLNAGSDNAVAQAQHGSAPDIAGQDRANPASLMGSAAMLLDWLSRRRGDPALSAAAAAIGDAIDGAVADKATRTGDLGGTLGTRAFTEVVVDHIQRLAIARPDGNRGQSA
jgi:3-isopropylmalate dehydrogenase